MGILVNYIPMLELDATIIKLLKEYDYTIREMNQTLIVNRKVVEINGMFFIFCTLGTILLALGITFLYAIPEQTEAILGLLILAVILLLVPFYPFIMAPYRGLVVDANGKTLLFRSARSRAYKFSEIDSVELLSDKKYADTNAFSDSNIEFSYELNLLFHENIKEEIFRITTRKAEDLRIQQLKEYLVKLLSS
ncbi:MAG: hypothetical protein JXQ96_19995 [Cyclobacteriaceae bacterium]